MIENVFDFKYKWEVYTPKDQRKYGYYVLPILFGDRFIGRIEPRKVDSILEVRGLWIEPNFNWDKRVNDSFNLYLEEFKKYLLASSIKWLCDKP